MKFESVSYLIMALTNKVGFAAKSTPMLAARLLRSAWSKLSKKYADKQRSSLVVTEAEGRIASLLSSVEGPPPLL
ncbi:unnamed protein product [Soboliphyme baturini]|uniref:HMG box domain-containing protein n=1 Tax=Soboliphyme baturini TaxID=241478 RepID=A0A183IYX3_9BILA|nr:unnamed protein product [Soboliphyme baturini]